MLQAWGVWDTAQEKGRHIDITALVEAGVVLPPTTSSGVHCIFFVMVVSPGAKSVGETGNNLCALLHTNHIAAAAGQRHGYCRRRTPILPHWASCAACLTTSASHDVPKRRCVGVDGEKWVGGLR